MRLSNILMPLAFATLASFSLPCGAQTELDSIIDDGPSWTAGGHYTAELDLGNKTLTVLPLDGTDQVIGLATLSAPKDLSAGVYMLEDHGGSFRLISTHPDGVVAPELESRALNSVLDQGSDALSLSTQAMAALSAANVGAIYIH